MRRPEGTRRCGNTGIELDIGEWEDSSGSPRDPGNCPARPGDRAVGLALGATLAGLLKHKSEEGDVPWIDQCLS